MAGGSSSTDWWKTRRTWLHPTLYHHHIFVFTKYELLPFSFAQVYSLHSSKAQIQKHTMHCDKCRTGFDFIGLKMNTYFRDLLQGDTQHLQSARQQSIGLHGQTGSQQSHCQHRAGPGRYAYRPPATNRLCGTTSSTRLWTFTQPVDFIEPTESSKETQSTTCCFPPLASHTGSHLSVTKEISKNKNPTLISKQLYMSLRSKWDSVEIHRVKTLICQSKLSALRNWEQLIAEGTSQSSKIPYKWYQNLLLCISPNDKVKEMGDRWLFWKILKITAVWCTHYSMYK